MIEQLAESMWQLYSDSLPASWVTSPTWATLPEAYKQCWINIATLSQNNLLGNLPKQEIDPDKVQRRIVCAANKYGDYIVLGVRHWDNFMRRDAKELVSDIESTAGKWEQGFVDQFGFFYTRQQALLLARQANQIHRRCGGDDYKLYSENLY